LSYGPTHTENRQGENTLLMRTGQTGAGLGPYVGDYGFEDLVKTGIEKRKARQHDAD